MADRIWLTSDEAAAALESAAGLSGELAVRLGRLRKTLPAERAGLVIEQLDLRHRAREKFSRAAEMFFTPKGLEQATDERIAAHKAKRFVGCGSVADLCCGIGGDLAALAAVSEATGIDRDAVCVHYAAANALPVARDPGKCGAVVQDVTAIDLAAYDAWHIDPDRRPEGRRTTRVELHEPSDEAIEAMLARNPHAAIKLAPAAALPDSWCERAELEWISRGRQCRQLVAWFGGLARFPGQRRATVLGAGEAIGSMVGGAEGDVPVAGRIGRYVFEPDAAVLAADLSLSVASALHLEALSLGIAYWTADAPVDGEQLLSTFEVLEVLPFDLKKLRAALAARDVGTLEIKVRGVDENPMALRAKLKLRGGGSATLLVTRIERGVTAIIARRVGSQ